MHERLRWDPATVEPAPSTWIVDPPRLVGVIAILAALVGAWVEWARPVAGFAPGSYAPLVTSDAALLIGIAIVGVPWLLLGSVAESRTRSVQIAGAVAGVLAITQWLTAVVRLGILLTPPNYWVQTSELGPVLLGAGSVTYCLVAVVLSVRLWRRNGVMDDPADGHVTRRAVFRSAIQVAIALVAGCLAIVVMLNLPIPPVAQALGAVVFVVGPIAAGGAGLWAGERIARRLLPDAPPTGR